MQHVLGMHSSETLCYLVQAPSNEVLTELAATLQDDISESPAFHELEDDPDALVELVDLVAVDQLLAVQMLDQAALVDDLVSLGSPLWLVVLERVVLHRLRVHHLEYGSEGALTNLLHDLVDHSRIFSLDFACLLKHGLDLFSRAEALHLLLCSHEDSPERHVRVLLHELGRIVRLKHRQVLPRYPGPGDRAISPSLKANLHIPCVVALVDKHEGGVADFLNCPEVVDLERVFCLFPCVCRYQLLDRPLGSLMELVALGLVELNDVEELLHVGELAALRVVLD